jgi:hypothetical protein
LIIEGATMSAAVIQVTSAAKVLAQLRARNMVKDHIRRRGEKLSAYKSAEITSWARLYVEDHPALQQQCLEEAKKMILLGSLENGRRRRFVQNSQQMHKKRSSQYQPLRPCKSHAQNKERSRNLLRPNRATDLRIRQEQI